LTFLKIGYVPAKESEAYLEVLGDAAAVAAGAHLAEGALAVHALEALHALARVVVARRGICNRRASAARHELRFIIQ
jgi:hypothetical protein